MKARINAAAARPRTFAALALTLLAGSTLAAPPGVRHVRADAAPGGDGLTWATAYNDLRQALIDAGASGGSVTELWVKEGTYLPGPAGSSDRTRSFTLVNDVGVYGGFAGTETERDQRDPAAHTTTLSGFLGGTVRVSNVVIGAGNAGTVLDGVTITDGNALQPPGTGTQWAGGGIHITGSPIIRNNTTGTAFHFPSTTPKMGAGVYCAPGSAATLIDCVIRSNTGTTALYNKSHMGGGLAAHGCSVHLVGCTFIENASGASGYEICGGGSPSGQSTPGHGGGLYALDAAVLMENCTFTANRTPNGSMGATCAMGSWPGLDAGNGAGLCSENSMLLALNCLFTKNRTGNGGQGAGGLGGGRDGGDGGIGGGLFTIGGDVNLVNCTIADNIVGAGGPGGTGSGGTGATGAAGYASSIKADTSARLENCISWNDGLNEIVGAVTAYCDVKGGYFGPGVITADPQFTDAASGDYRLSDTSPCIDAGNSFPAAALPATDLAGLARRVDIASVPDTGVGAPVVDMGAYEVQACVVDLNGDGLVDFSDYLEFLNLFDAGDLRVDFTGDGIVDFSDYLEFLNLYEAGC